VIFVTILWGFYGKLVWCFAEVGAGGLRLILEFGSITFLLVSLLMAVANFKIRAATHSSTGVTLLSISGLLAGSGLILHYEYQSNPTQLASILVLYLLLSLGAWGYARYVRLHQDST
jgi:CHASE2 domain-containing sensor protein